MPSSSERTHTPNGAGGESEVFAKVRRHGPEVTGGDINVKKGVGGQRLGIFRPLKDGRAPRSLNPGPCYPFY
jgi:hypothetical protein